MNKIKNNITKISAAVLLGTFGVAAAQQVNGNSQVQEAHAATTAGGAVTVNYPNYSIAVWNNYQGGHPTGQYLKHGTSWKVIKTATDSQGNLWYDLGLNQWIMAKYTKDGANAVSQSTSASAKISAVINLAQRQGGKPYVWGAKGPNSFDCSGLMYYVFKNAAGKNIGGWTVAQESAGRQVSISQLQAGDLVFWGNHGSTYHVALYIGNGKYIHAPQPGQGVTVGTISSYFQPSFGVRVF